MTSLAQPNILDPQLQLARFRQYLKWQTISLSLSTLLYGLVAAVFGSILAGIIAAVCLGGVIAGLVAWNLLGNERLTAAVLLCAAALLGGALLVVLAAPGLYPADALVPLLAVVIALPYLPKRTLLGLILVCSLFSLVIVMLGVYIDPLQLPPPSPALMGILLTCGFASAVALICLLLWQFSSRLSDMLGYLRTTNESLESTNTALANANTQLNDRLDQQRQLLNLVTTLETPAVPLAEGVLFIPIVGHVDTRRALDLNERLLNAASDQRARLVILDISGVSVIDTEVAQALLQTAQALRLLGCQVALSGISPENALTLTHLEVDLHGVSTVRSPQEALASWTDNTGYLYGGDQPY
jgi:rsbT co-antagonist protein RsbR